MGLERRPGILATVALVIVLAGGWGRSDTVPRAADGSPARAPLAFASYAPDAAAVAAAASLAESIRTFAGAHRDAPIHLYLSPPLLPLEATIRQRLDAARVRVAAFSTPPALEGLPYAGKAFSAAAAERDLGAECAVLARLDPDTLVLREPAELALPAGVAVAYVPVHQVLVGSAAGRPPDAFWSRVYRVLGIPASRVFNVKTVVEGAEVRAYFNAGLMAVRPARGVFRRWEAALTRLAADPGIREMVRQDRARAMFLHQVALAGAVLQAAEAREALQLPPRYNYPLALVRAPEPLDRFVTVRYENLLTTPGWSARVRAPEAILEWLRARFPQ